jgi:hypothetical protein
MSTIVIVRVQRRVVDAPLIAGDRASFLRARIPRERVFERSARPVRQTKRDTDMRKATKLNLTSALLVLSSMAAFPDFASAGPMSVTSAPLIEASSPTEQIHFRRYYPRHYGYYRHYRHYGYHRRYGPYGYNNPVGAAAGAAAGLATLPLRAVFGNPYYY